MAETHFRMVLGVDVIQGGGGYPPRGLKMTYFPLISRKIRLKMAFSLYLLEVSSDQHIV